MLANNLMSCAYSYFPQNYRGASLCGLAQGKPTISGIRNTAHVVTIGRRYAEHCRTYLTPSICLKLCYSVYYTRLPIAGFAQKIKDLTQTFPIAEH